MNRIDLVLAETGAIMSLDMDLRMMLYLSDAAEDRMNKRKKAAELAAAAAKRRGGL